MSMRGPGQRPMVLGGLVLVLVVLAASSARGETTATLCVPEAAGKPVVSGTSEGTCTKANYNAVALPGSGGLATLNKVLPHISYVEKGVGGKPTIQFSGVNVQIVNGEGKTATTNGEGNLVIGYDENPGTVREFYMQPRGAQTGSHNLILGEEQEFTAYAGIDAGFLNSIKAPYASVSGGNKNTASGQWAAVSGGETNHASGEAASVSGGDLGSASGVATSVTGGGDNRASSLRGT